MKDMTLVGGTFLVKEFDSPWRHELAINRGRPPTPLSWY